MFSVLVVDDEPLAREGLRIHLRRYACIANIQSACDAEQAITVLTEQQFHAIFLDIDLPGMSGFGVLETLRRRNIALPVIIFTTGHSEFALRAFDYPVLDYLLKPIAGSRMQRCVNKLIARFPETNIAKMQKSTKKKQPLSIPNGSVVLQLWADDLLWVEAAGDYMLLHTKHKQHIIRSTLKALKDLLAAHDFVQISRSILINSNSVVTTEANKNGTNIVTLSDHSCLQVSPKYKLLMDKQKQSYAALN